jgi:hypothetical protein
MLIDPPWVSIASLQNVSPRPVEFSIWWPRLGQTLRRFSRGAQWKSNRCQILQESSFVRGQFAVGGRARKALQD